MNRTKTGFLYELLDMLAKECPCNGNRNIPSINKCGDCPACIFPNCALTAVEDCAWRYEFERFY